MADPFKTTLALLLVIGTVILGAVPANTNAATLTLLTEELPPLNYTQDGELIGFSLDVVRELQRRVGNTDAIEVVPWARGYKAALERPNTVLFSTARTQERESLFQWVGPLVRWQYVFYKKRGSPIILNTLDDARRVRSIATYRDDAREQFLKEHGFDNLDSSPKLVSCARKLMEGRVDLWLDSNLTARQVMQQIGFSGDEIEPVLAFKSNYLYIAFSRSTPSSIVQRWQLALDAMNRDQSFAAIYQRWLPDETPPASDGLRAAARDIRLAVYTEDLPPYNFVKETQVTGFSVDLVREIMRRVGTVAPIQVVPWSRGYQKALEEPNVALFSTVRSAQRETLFKWVGPLTTSESVLYAQADSGVTLTSLDDAKQIESIGTYQDDVDEQFLREHGFTNLYSHSNPLAIMRNLMAGRVQLAIFNNFSASQLLRQAGLQSDAIKPVLTTRNTALYVAFSQQTPDALTQLWQDALDSIHEDGTFTRIYQSWLQGAPAHGANNVSGVDR
ncbi:MAG: transporter substrate-binding domain-containing protein [Candidatus Competibacteraceae bacterium]|jgi:polar amino acid transport system substrate-binding protein|nr:transporter substrate-binding domain-containing protein [Candidatus Competibacteraceae bacterium]